MRNVRGLKLYYTATAVNWNQKIKGKFLLAHKPWKWLKIQKMAFLRAQIFNFPREHVPGPPKNILIHLHQFFFPLSLTGVWLQPCEKTVLVHVDGDSYIWEVATLPKWKTATSATVVYATSNIGTQHCGMRFGLSMWWNELFVGVFSEVHWEWLHAHIWWPKSVIYTTFWQPNSVVGSIKGGGGGTFLK